MPGSQSIAGSARSEQWDAQEALKRPHVQEPPVPRRLDGYAFADLATLFQDLLERAVDQVGGNTFPQERAPRLCLDTQLPASRILFMISWGTSLSIYLRTDL